ncbi:hypothetical protein C8Q76DRAFT_219214 [Earliella scabrosa]|nr:hypothetical protein C8Q76DRAFT_219214 [Earliella scabrosa]
MRVGFPPSVAPMAPFGVPLVEPSMNIPGSRSDAGQPPHARSSNSNLVAYTSSSSIATRCANNTCILQYGS